MKKIVIIFCTICMALSMHAQRAMNRPYADEKPLHLGFSLGTNFMSYLVTESLTPISGSYTDALGKPISFSGDTLYARVSNLMPGFSVGFITDYRLCRYLNLRFTPQLHFGIRNISYQSTKGVPIISTDVLSLPITVPLELKWSAMREGNYRPYVIAGAGVSYNINPSKTKPVVPESFDYFVQVGAGCDFYFSWFKLCPEIKYQIGLRPLGLVPSETTSGFYADAISSLRHHMVTLIFNFE
ncbi:MAG: PorT family protein [Paludibacteraceae bacterium]|nr:PorT family protein [Paludibacteraceae bacterium]